MWRFVCLLAVAGMLALPTSGDAMRGKKEKLKAKINGKAFKANNKKVPIVGAYDATSHLVTLSGTSIKGLTKVTTKIVNLSCVAPLEGTTFPLTTLQCTTLVSISVGSIHGVSATGWGGDGITMTVTSFDGVRLTGTFEGTLPPNELEGSPANITKGVFAVDLNI